MKSTVLSVAVGTVLLGASITGTAAQPSTSFNPLRVEMRAAGAKAGALLGVVDVVITNTSSNTVRVPKQRLPSDDLEASLFQVSRDGKPVAYEGKLVKRGLPQAEDFAVLKPGQQYRVQVDLSGAYDLSRSGYYSVTLRSPLQHASVAGQGAGTGMLKALNGQPLELRSTPLRLWVDGSDQLGAVLKKGKPGGGGTLVNGITYKGCTTTRMNSIDQAITAARNYTENSKNYLNAGTAGPRYTTWFGSYTSSRYNTAKQHFTAIDSAMDQNGGQITVNCGCSSSAYAYVYPNQPYEIYVCKAFWSAPVTGTDSKAGTLVHEMSHFNVVAGTDDVVYGQSGAKNLALTDPNGALNNADSHEYFAENNPAQN
ncbi:M35 family metallo-endopeptidase [Luteimonas aquatica]|uniref:M35 family metallo-endopeptidase n=1 Tax=Luteimonas aquatica TaxID=450364 RepID=UPI001F586F78|nr:M35 family metallo-endopeptidase [Luteimonas aquatica]